MGEISVNTSLLIFMLIILGIMSFGSIVGLVLVSRQKINLQAQMDELKLSKNKSSSKRKKPKKSNSQKKTKKKSRD